MALAGDLARPVSRRGACGIFSGFGGNKWFPKRVIT